MDPIVKIIFEARLRILFRQHPGASLISSLALQQVEDDICVTTDGDTLFYNRAAIRELTMEELIASLIALLPLIPEKSLPVGQKDRNDESTHKELTTVARAATPTKFAFLKDVEVVKKKVGIQKSPRDAFIAAIDKQIAAAEFLRDGKDLQTGKKASRLWFKSDFAGNITTDIRYGSKPIPLPGVDKGNTFKIGQGYDTLIAFYEKVRESAEAGEFDDLLVQMSNEIASRLGR